MKILIDTNVVLDIILEREPFVEQAIELFELIEQREVEGYIAATTITNVFYIVRKARGREVALETIQRLLIGFQFCAVNRQTVETALALGLKDFEDSVQLACASNYQLDGVVTRNQKAL